ncbi:exosortase [Fischerella thermalis CCMEE 5201]|jgi:glucose/arabinose dehydrogenase|nr:exosortase [Fischerella thermalis CCMEE 5201]
MFKTIALAATAATMINFGIAQAVQAVKIEVLASGLDSPRKLSFAPDGTLYVTEAGRGGDGPCITIPGTGGLSCYGTTSAITQIKKGKAKRVLTGLPSLALPNGDAGNGATDIAFDEDGNAFVLLSWGADLNLRNTDSRFSQFGTLIRIDKFKTSPKKPKDKLPHSQNESINDQCSPTQAQVSNDCATLKSGFSFTQIADLVNFEATNNPDGKEILSNTFSLLIKDNTAFLTDAAGNDALSVETNGSNLTVQAVFPQRLVPSPFGGPDLSMQSVPTAIALGPDGAIYVGELTGFPFPQGEARVYRINPITKQPEIYATGFTNIIDIDFDSQGNLYVLEYATNSLLSEDRTGALIRVFRDGTRETILKEGLISPTGLALGSDGYVYISNNGLTVGKGEVIRIRL